MANQPMGSPSRNPFARFLHAIAHGQIAPWYGAYALLGALASGFVPILAPLVMDARGASATLIGAVMATLNLGLLSCPVWGSLADGRRAYRLVFSIGFVLLGLAIGAFTLNGGPAVELGLGFIMGLGSGASNTMANLFVVEFYPRSEWDSRIGVLLTFNAVGQSLALVLAGMLLPRVGLPLAAALALPAIVLGNLGLPITRTPFGGPSLSAVELKVDSFIRHSELWAGSLFHYVERPRLPTAQTLRVAFSGNFGRFLAGWLILSFGATALFALYPVLMREAFAIRPAASSTIYAATVALSVALYGPAARYSNRLGAATVYRVGIWCRVVALAGMVALAYLAPPFRFIGIVVCFTIFQLAWPLLFVSGTDLAAGLSTVSEGEAMGLFGASGALASAAGALASGVVAQTLGYGATVVLATVAVMASVAPVRQLATPAKGATTAPAQGVGMRQ